ncbi:MAG: amino acid--[acyl-carrier-protein] ligase [Gemmatimonadaceae bacterium]|nr:amino acid--[acyl-carrier-protein] ligase [Gemmatimonadaceae bacterium]
MGTSVPAATPAAPATLGERLCAHGHLLPLGPAGIVGKGADFERVLQAIDRAAAHLIDADHAERLSFPPVLPRELAVRAGYQKSFPHLLGVVHAFAGGDREHDALVASVEAGGDWGPGVAQTDLILTPAACYPIYASLRDGVLPPGGRTVTVTSYCFRREPSDDPARMQAFRMTEAVRLGTATEAIAFRDRWLTQGERFLASLGLDVRVVVANDPFFGRRGKMLAASQRDRALKYEIVATVGNADRPTAIASANCHETYFGEQFRITTAGLEVASTACFGFGLERITLALFAAHGMQVARWPRQAREVLGL